MIDILIIPFLACISLVFIHVYFGAFVLKRGILFIDLALAQWAALGYLVGHWMGVENSYSLFLIGFGFTIIAASILSLIKPLFKAINLQEAVIGVMYILAAASATALISSTGMEGHHLKEMLSGHLLFIHPSDLIFSISLYAIIAAILLVVHRKITHSSSRTSEFIFYVLFGCVVTSSVKMVGILLVFSFLVLPLLSITLFIQDSRLKIVVGWMIGIMASLMGLGLSMLLDIPPSFCIILVLCGVWLLGTLGYLALKFKL